MPPKPKLPGMIKGLGVTMSTMFRTVTKGADTNPVPARQGDTSDPC